MQMVAVAATAPEMQKNKIQVSNTKKPLFFYVNLAKRYMQQHNEVELSALGMGTPSETCQLLIKHSKHLATMFLIGCEGAITTVVTIAEILKNNGLAVEKKVLTSTVGMKDETKGRLVQKARIQIVLVKSEKFDSLIVASPAAPEAIVDNKDESKQ